MADTPTESSSDAPRAKASLGDTLRRLGPAAPLFIAVTFLPPIGLMSLTTLATTTQLPDWMRQHPTIAVPLYVVLFWIVGICAMPTYAYSVLGGYAFGFWPALVGTTLAYTGASAAAFAIARRIGRERVTPLVEEHPYLSAVRHAVVDASLVRATLIIGLLRISPASPYAITNVVLGAGGVRWVPFLIGSMLGVIPRTIAVIYVASRMSVLSFKTSEAWWMLAAGIVATVVVIAVIAKLARKELDRQLKTTAPQKNPG